MQKIFYTKPTAAEKVSKVLSSAMADLKVFTAPVVLCIGSDRVTGDALGPITGHLLTTEFNTPLFVYGTLSSPVTALNLSDTLTFIKKRHHFSPVIAVDSSLGRKEDVGKVRVINGGIYPGAATNKSLPLAGDISLTATVAQNRDGELYSVRLGFIYQLSRIIAESIDITFSKTCALSSDKVKKVL